MDIQEPDISTRSSSQHSARHNASALKKTAQWIVFAILTLLALAIATELRKAGAPGAPLVLLYITIGAAVALALVHLPPIFGRLPRKGQWMAYASIIAMFVLFGSYLQQMEPAWAATPEGKKELADKAEADRFAAAERAQAEAREKADREAVAREAADQKLANLEAQKPGICKILVDQVVSQSKSGDGPEVIEINNVVPDSGVDPDRPISCSGDAITSRGNMTIEFGLVRTPQGKELLNYRLQ